MKHIKEQKQLAGITPRYEWTVSEQPDLDEAGKVVEVGGNVGPVQMLWDFVEKIRRDKYMFDMYSDYVRNTSVAKQFWQLADLSSMAAGEDRDMPMKDARNFVKGLKSIAKQARDSIKKHGFIPRQKDLLSKFKSDVVDEWAYALKNFAK